MARKKKKAEVSVEADAATEAAAVDASGESTAETSKKTRRMKGKKSKPAKAAKVEKKKRSKSAEGASKSEAAKETPAPAAVNKTQAVKNFLAANPKARTREIRAALVEQGVEISANYISLIKSQLKKRKKRAAPQSDESAAGSSKSTGGASSGELSIELLVKAKRAAEALGGVEVARGALAALLRLLD